MIESREVEYDKKNPETIRKMFDLIAPRYDLTNAVVSFSLHKKWNRRLVNTLLQNIPDHTYIDLCSGTGDIAFDYLNCSTVSCQAYLVDFSSEMLKLAKRKESETHATKHRIGYLEADAASIPLSDRIADVVSMAYGIRNVKDPLACMQEVHRLLKPGGIFGILELTRPENPVLRFGHRLYLGSVLPLLGKMLTDNRPAYRYLCTSIANFIAPEEIERLLIETGFTQTSRLPLLGGIATIVTGYKPRS